MFKVSTSLITLINIQYRCTPSDVTIYKDTTLGKTCYEFSLDKFSLHRLQNKTLTNLIRHAGLLLPGFLCRNCAEVAEESATDRQKALGT